ncbi:hypothetical protein NKDENANG_00280 [Candidatus Entotheonellaceae bacterium PAL068K]
MRLRAISVVSAAAIGYEILLIRLFSMVQWHHFAYMIISIGLLGYGVSGTFLALTQHWLLPRFVGVFMSSAVLFGLTAVGSFVIGQHLPFNPPEIVWDPGQWFYLLLLYLLFCVPFFCAATCIGLTLIRLRADIGRIYRADLIGAGAGALGIVLLLFLLPHSICLQLLGASGFMAAALAGLDWAGPRRWWLPLPLLFIGLLLAAICPRDWVTPRLSAYKELSQVLQVPDTQVLSQRSSPLGVVTVVRSPTIPFRYAPGLSLNSPLEPPPQLGMFTDGEGLSVITQYDGRPEPLAYLDGLPSALPYHLRQRPSVLILGVGGGADVLQAHYHRARRIDAVELNAQVVDLVTSEHAEFAGPVYSADAVRLHIAEARGFMTTSRKRYDIIQVPLLDSFSTAAGGVQALSENYLYTVEALRATLDHLRPGGWLTLSRWLKLPPRDSLKLFATALTALEQSGVAHPARHLVLIRGLQTTTLLVKNGELTPQEIASLQSFCEARWFDVAYYPGMTAATANRYNVLRAPYFFEAAMALVGDDRQAFIRRYPYAIAPATDDRPYFSHFFTWRALPEMLAWRAQGALSLVDWGYLILIAALLQATVVSFVLIVLPLRRRQHRAASGWLRSRIGGYFAALGLAFLFIEIAFMQRFILFLSHPLYAIAVVLCAFLVFAGLGSGYATRYSQRSPLNRGQNAGRPIALAVSGIAILALLYLVLLGPLFHCCLDLPLLIKIAISLGLIAPLAFCMGLPFPLGLSLVAQRAPELIPWAWGMNGCTSVLSAILATILAIHFGFTVVLGAALILYVLAAAMVFKPLA